MTDSSEARPLTLKQLLFSFEGRIGRRTFARLVLFFVILSLFIQGLVIPVSRLHGEVRDTPSDLWRGSFIGITLLIGLAGFIWANTASTVKRLHDQNYSGWWWAGYALCAIVLLHYAGRNWFDGLAVVWVAVVMGLPGTKGPNHYGVSAPRPRSSRGSLLSVAIIVALVILGLIAAVRLGLIQSFYIAASSNVPTLAPGDYIVVEANPSHSLPARGDMIALRLSDDPSVVYLKRVIGLPGDQVQMVGGRLYLNGAMVPRTPIGPYSYTEDGFPNASYRFRETLPGGRSYEILQQSDSGPVDNTPIYTVPANTVFTLGDNRSNSRDSRFLGSFGYIPLANIVGRADCRYFSVDPDIPHWNLPSAIRAARILTEIR